MGGILNVAKSIFVYSINYLEVIFPILLSYLKLILKLFSHMHGMRLFFLIKISLHNLFHNRMLSHKMENFLNHKNGVRVIFG